MRTSQHEVLSRIDEVAKVLIEDEAKADDLRLLPETSVKVLRESGIVRLLQPVRYGGYEASPRVFFEAVMKVAAANGSAGWVAGVVGVHPWHMALYDDRLQNEIWGGDPNTWVSSAYMPGGKATAVDGGYQLSGRWRFSSGSEHCSWAVLGSLIDNSDPAAPPQRLNVVVPRSDYEIVDVWDVIGLRGTGSNDIVVKDKFVPLYRTLDPELLGARDIDDSKIPGRALNTGPLYGMAFGPMFADSIAAALVGMGEGALSSHVDYQKSKTISVKLPIGRPLPVDDPFALATIGTASCALDAARLQLLDDIDEMYESACAGRPVPFALRLRARRNQVVFINHVVEVVDTLFIRAGGRAIYNQERLQRFWRDIHAGRNHTINIVEDVMVTYARNLVGQELGLVMA